MNGSDIYLRMLRAFVAAVALTLIAPPVVFGCDTDADCGAGGTCIKRERRARGVCYGGQPGAAPNEAAPSPVVPGPEFFDPLSAPLERPKNACMVTEECPAGMECVIAGVWGTCMAL